MPETPETASVTHSGAALSASRRPFPDGGRETRARAVRRFARSHPVGFVSLLLIALLVLMAVFAPLIAPYDPLLQHRDAVLAPPGPQFWLGTDNLGRDVLSRAVFGAQTSLITAAVSVTIAFLVGIVVGALSGLVGKAVDIVFQRIMDAIESVPAIVLLMFIAAALGPSLQNVIIALTIVIVPGYNRIARAETLRLRAEGYVEAAQVTGANVFWVVRKHIVPNMLAPMLTLATISFGAVIVAESGLTYLGIGTPPPTPSWGQMLEAGRDHLTTSPWLVGVPAVAISIAVLAFNLFGDALRDHFDTRMKRF